MDMVKRIDGHILVFKCLELYGHRILTQKQKKMLILFIGVLQLLTWDHGFRVLN